MRTLNILLISIACLFAANQIKAQQAYDLDFIKTHVQETFEQYPDVYGLYFTERDTMPKWDMGTNVPRMRQLHVYLIPQQGKALFSLYSIYYDVYEIPISESFCGMCDSEGNVIWALDSNKYQFHWVPGELHAASELFIAGGQIDLSKDEQYTFVDEKGNIQAMFPWIAEKVVFSPDKTVITRGLRSPAHGTSPYPIRYNNIKTGQQWEWFFDHDFPWVREIETNGKYVLIEEGDSLRCIDAKGNQVWVKYIPMKDKSVRSNTFNTFLLVDRKLNKLSMYGPEMKKLLYQVDLEEYKGFPSHISWGAVAHEFDCYAIGYATKGAKQARVLILDENGVIENQLLDLDPDRKDLGKSMIIKDNVSGKIRIYSNKGRLIHEMKGRNDGTDNRKNQKKK